MLLSGKRQDVVFIFKKDSALLRGQARKLMVTVRHVRGHGYPALPVSRCRLAGDIRFTRSMGRNRFACDKGLSCSVCGKGRIRSAYVSCRAERLRRPEHDAQHALCRAVNVLLREPPILHGRKTLIFHIGAASRHIEVAARLKALDPVVHRTPVRHDHAVKAPVLP